MKLISATISCLSFLVWPAAAQEGDNLQGTNSAIAELIDQQAITQWCEVIDGRSYDFACFDVQQQSLSIVVIDGRYTIQYNAIAVERLFVCEEECSLIDDSLLNAHTIFDLDSVSMAAQANFQAGLPGADTNLEDTAGLFVSCNLGEYCISFLNGIASAPEMRLTPLLMPAGALDDLIDLLEAN